MYQTHPVHFCYLISQLSEVLSSHCHLGELFFGDSGNDFLSFGSEEEYTVLSLVLGAEKTLLNYRHKKSLQLLLFSFFREKCMHK